MKKQLLWGILALVLVCLIGLSACSSNQSTTSASTSTSTNNPKYGGTLRVADPIGPMVPGWPADPGFNFGGPYFSVFFDTILSDDLKGNILPNLATKWEIAQDMKSITLTLKQGVKFHDGSDWNAEVAKWNIDTHINANDVNYSTVASVDTLDNYTIRLNMKQYSNVIFTNLAETDVVSKAAYDKNGLDWMKTHPVGTGPFKLDNFTPDVSIKGVRFDDYWGGKPYLDAIEIYKITDTTTRAASFENGERDVIGGDLSKTEYDLAQKGFEVQKAYTGIWCLFPDSKNTDSPFGNLKVRQAVNFAINRDEICKSLGYGWWAPLSEFAIPGSPNYMTDLPANPFDPDKAKQLLKDAGYAGGFTSTIIADAFVSSKDAVSAMQSYLSNVGIKVDISMVDMAGASSYTAQGWHNALFGVPRGGMAVNWNAAGLTYFTNDNVAYPSILKTPEYDKLYHDSLTAKEYDPALAQKALRYVNDNVLVIPIYAAARGYVLQHNVHDTGFYTHSGLFYWNPAVAWLSK